MATAHPPCPSNTIVIKILVIHKGDTTTGQVSLSEMYRWACGSAAWELMSAVSTAVTARAPTLTSADRFFLPFVPLFLQTTAAPRLLFPTPGSPELSPPTLSLLLSWTVDPFRRAVTGWFPIHFTGGLSCGRLSSGWSSFEWPLSIHSATWEQDVKYCGSKNSNT